MFLLNYCFIFPSFAQSGDCQDALKNRGRRALEERLANSPVSNVFTAFSSDGRLSATIDSEGLTVRAVSSGFVVHRYAAGDLLAVGFLAGDRSLVIAGTFGEVTRFSTLSWEVEAKVRLRNRAVLPKIIDEDGVVFINLGTMNTGVHRKRESEDYKYLLLQYDGQVRVLSR